MCMYDVSIAIQALQYQWSASGISHPMHFVVVITGSWSGIRDQECQKAQETGQYCYKMLLGTAIKNCAIMT